MDPSELYNPYAPDQQDILHALDDQTAAKAVPKVIADALDDEAMTQEAIKQFERMVAKQKEQMSAKGETPKSDETASSSKPKPGSKDKKKKDKDSGSEGEAEASDGRSPPKKRRPRHTVKKDDEVEKQEVDDEPVKKVGRKRSKPDSEVAPAAAGITITPNMRSICESLREFATAEYNFLKGRTRTIKHVAEKVPEDHPVWFLRMQLHDFYQQMIRDFENRYSRYL
jgi:hypothetical protein